MRFLQPAGVLAIALVLAACDEKTGPIMLPPMLREGTWGTDGAGMIVSDSVAHVHVGCTLGNFVIPEHLDHSGEFSVRGSYVLRAYPVQFGPDLPAQFSGRLRGDRLTLTVAVNDTVEKQLVIKGPVTLTYRREPRIPPCPICRTRPR